MGAVPANYDMTGWSISEVEINQALANGSLVLADAVLDEGYQRVYNITSNCNEYKGLKCLYAYLYLLQNYKESSTISTLPEGTIMAVLTHIEQISKSCCNGM
jgi:hypothetical protein